jgi:tRNA A-37 threonylcarbamoyl transferase component Bud32/tetratricopeptide (TPR) repeat protein
VGTRPSLTLVGPLVPPPPGARKSGAPTIAGDAGAPTRALSDDAEIDLGRPLVALAPGAAIAGTRYRLVRWLGDGGMGVVYEAEHVDLDRRVALKILRSEACRRPQLVDMFRAEARIVARIRSEYIVEVYDFAEVPDGRALFTMELLEGRTLRSALNEGSLDPARTIAIARQVCKGLAAAHDAGVVHRDIKPENVFLTRRRGRADAVRLLDFGISAILADARLAASRAAGTPWYLAPERVAGLAHDGRADIYALGCTMYEMLSGKRPFEGDEHEVLFEQIEREPPPLAETAPDRSIPPALAAVVMRCLAKMPDERFANAAELEAALCEAQIEAGLHTGWDDLPVPEVEPARRERLLLGMPDPLARPSSKTSGWRRALAIGGALVVAGAVAASVLSPRRADLERIDALTVEARAAAARDYFVYPPADSPDTPTAFLLVLEMETVDGLGSFAAERRAQELRREFADTLVRLGDRYWEHPAGRAFAVDYYAEALVFDPDHPIATERAPLSPGNLAELERKAGTQSFTDSELAAVAPLEALAKEDPEELHEAVVALRKKAPAWGGRIESQLDHIVATTKTAAPPVASAPIATSVAKPDAAATKPIDPFVESPAVTAPAPKVSASDTKRWLAEGRARLAAGAYAAARRAFERVLASEPRHAGALAGIAKTAYEEGKYVESVKYAERAVAAAPKKADHVLLLGDAYFKSFRYGDAKTQYQRALALGHASANARLQKVADKLKR